MNKNKIFLFLFSLMTLTACSSIESYIPSFITDASTPAAIQEAVASRVNPDKELYSVASSQLSKSVVNPAFSDLANYSTDLSMKKSVQKGAWEDGEKVYSLLTVDRSEILKITDTVFKDFIKTASKNLGNVK